ncbi:uncharacterized protein BDR25DRAFT_17757 [Lindgomyces ingoldianus]|uniref:Uncharacterized protein n=1 Tax=Lindgomyces ingoldianus TaxID=673940 RepID=A0ACB6QZP6_9PLEO|nr:uncharacterized protein BDR25DRAFT_17757 [Lindgomyces ingoldianus]KAF2472043.1 hypothetical protein BDR25DRAFT_17757 [Lindgomyces ingoldianus]
MVGVPGKSKGCITCRRRRIKCDEAKPTCKRCEKSGYICAGYDTGLHFINTSTAPFRESRSSTTTTPAKQYDRKTSIKIVPRIRTVVVAPELSLVAFQSDVCVSYMFSNFVWRTYGSGWLDLGAEGRIDAMTRQSINALSQTFFGVSHHQEQLQLKGSMQYGKVLTLLRPKLANPSNPGLEYLIIPVMVLLMHASYEEDKTACIAHVKGLLMMLHVCGPEKFQKEPLRSAFESARATLVTTFLIARQPLFLDQEPWKSIPWALDPSTKSQQNHLVDILVHIPGFLASDSKLQECPDAGGISSLLHHIKSRLYTLYVWRYEWDVFNPSAAWETTPPSPSSIPRVVPKKLHFQTHTQAAEILLYNAVHMWLLSLLFRLSPHDPTVPTSTILTTALTASTLFPLPASSSPSPLQPPAAVLSLRDIAIEICRCFEYQMESPQSHRSSSLFFLFPLGMAWPVLEKEERYRDWIRGMLDSSDVTRGYAIGRNVWFSNYYLPKVFGLKMPGPDPF